MHPNPVFHDQTEARNLAFARERGFGQLSVFDGTRPRVAHVPFLVSEQGDRALLHLVRSNPIARACAESLPSVVTVAGPDGYISPDWYGVADQVPTWNYVAVELFGRLHPLPVDTLAETLALQSAHFEAVLAPKPAWTMDKMSEGAKSRLMRMILPFELRLEEVRGTWKLNQNKTPEARIGAAQGVETFGIGMDTKILAALMHGVGTEETQQ